MASLIDLMLTRTSVRSFEDKPIEVEKLNKLKQVINAAPTSINGHHFSAIIITDNETKEFIAKNNLNQEWIKTAPLLVVFMADINRIKIAQSDMNNMELPIVDSPNMLISGAVDCTIAATNLFDAALSLGLGGCYLGGVRGNIVPIAKKLKLEGRCTPILAVALGYPLKINDIKPKLNKVYENEYSLNLVKQEIKDYNVVMEDYYKERETLTLRGKQIKHGPLNWSINTVLTYSLYVRPDYLHDLAKQFEITYFKNDKH